MNDELYAVMAVYNSIHGEGKRTGRRSVVVSFSGCNLWEGSPVSRERGCGPCSLWCDADFKKGEVISTPVLLQRMDQEWPLTDQLRWCVLTGGEPMLQLDLALLDALHANGWKVAVETNGTIDKEFLRYVDWLCVSPKKGVELKVRKAHELKVVLPGVAPSEVGGWSDQELLDLANAGEWRHLCVQPQDVLLGKEPGKTALVLVDAEDEDAETLTLANVAVHCHLNRAIEFVMAHPEWALSAQVHKLLGLR